MLKGCTKKVCKKKERERQRQPNTAENLMTLSNMHLSNFFPTAVITT
jgi:hypothetical protein